MIVWDDGRSQRGRFLKKEKYQRTRGNQQSEKTRYHSRIVDERTNN